MAHMANKIHNAWVPVDLVSFDLAFLKISQSYYCIQQKMHNQVAKSTGWLDQSSSAWTLKQCMNNAISFKRDSLIREQPEVTSNSTSHVASHHTKDREISQLSKIMKD